MLQAFENWLRTEKRYSEHTVKSYKTDISQFQNFLSDRYQVDKIENCETNYIKSWIIEISEQGMSSRSLSRKITALNTYFRFLIIEGKVKSNPAKSIKAPKSPVHIVKYLEEEDLAKLLNEFEFEETFEGQRDQLVFELLYGTGIRLSELIGLKLGDIDLNSLSLKVIGKRNKERMIPINISLKNQLIKYLKIRKNEFSGSIVDELLLTSKGNKLYPMFVYRLVKRNLDSQQSKVNVSPHVLRHSFATHLMNRGADINAIKELLGHANLAATQIYTHTNIGRLKEVFRQTHPRSGD